MGDDFSNLGQWQDGIERRVSDLESKVDEQAGLRAKMDEELGTVQATLKAHTQSLNALQEVQGDHTRRLTRIEDEVRSIREDMGTVKVGVHAINDLLNANLARLNLEKKSLASRIAARFARHREAA